MGKIVELHSNKKTNKEKEPIQFEDGRVHIDISDKDSFVFAFSNDETHEANTFIFTGEPEEAVALILCLMEIAQREIGCTKGELLSTIVELFVDEETSIEED